MANPFQAAGNVFAGSGTSRTFPITAATGAGDTLLAIIDVNATGLTVSGVSDSAGNVYTQDENSSAATPTLQGWRSPGATGGSGGGATGALTTSNNLIVTTSATSANVEAVLIDVPGVGAVDQITAIALNSSTTPSVSLTPGHDNETIVVYATWKQAGGAGTWNGSLTGFAGEQTGTNAYLTGAYEVLGSSTSGVPQTLTATITSTNWKIGAWSFQAGSSSFSGTGTSALSLSTSESGSSQRSGTASSALTLSESATGSKRSASTDAAALSLGTSVSGSVVPYSGTGTAALTPGTSVSGTSVRTSTASAALTLSETASGTSVRSGTASAALTLSTAASGEVPSSQVYFMLGGVLHT